MRRRNERDMSVTADARVQTKDAGRCLAQLCAHLSEKAQRRPELGVRVESSETHGTVDFGWGRCTMRADANALVLRAEADDQEGLEQVEEFIARHLKTHAEAGRLTV